MNFSTQETFQRVLAVTKFHFISGMPCSDVGALSAVLAQNPRFSSRSDSPAAEICAELLVSCDNPGSAFHRLPGDGRAALLRGALDAVYTARPLDGVVFDSHPDWMTQIGSIARSMPLSRFIFVVRDPVQIIEQLARERELPISQQPGFAHELVGKDGAIGASLSAIRAALVGPFADRVILIERSRFIGDPEGVISSLYEFLREHKFSHKFNLLDALKTDPPIMRRSLRQIIKSRPMQGWRAARRFSPVWRELSRSPASLLLAKAI